jgi:hypothetical protein
MNGNAGADSSGTGATAMAATGGDSAGCECPEPAADVFFERDCGEKMVGSQPWAVLTVPGASVDDLARITATYRKVDNDGVAGTPDAQASFAITAFSEGIAYAQCFGIARFRVPADLAELIAN